MTIGNAISLIKLAIPLSLLLGLLWFKHEANHYRLAYDLRGKAIMAANAATKAAQAQSHVQATLAQKGYLDALSEARTRASEYIRAHQLVRPGGVQDNVPNAEGAATGDASIPAISTASSVVVGIESGDVMTATDNYTYARACYDWVQGLKAAGLAK